jgi:hypothetical protein
MRNITLSADERLIEAARERARAERTTLNEQFRRWLQEYAGCKEDVQETMRFLEQMRTRVSTAGQRFTREERNAR